MLSVDSDTDYCAQLPLCDTDLGEGTDTDLGEGVVTGIGTNDERREDVAVLTSQDGVIGQKSVNAKRNEYKSIPRIPQLRKYCRLRQGAVLLLGVFLTMLALTLVVVGGVKSRQRSGIQLLHMQTPVNLKSLMYLGDENFTFVQLMALTNVALDRPASQSSTATPEADVRENAGKALDGNLSTCSNTGLERRPEWQVDLQKSRVVKSIRIHGSNNFNLRNMVIYVTATNDTASDNVCGKVIDHRKGVYAHVKCGGRMRGRYVMIASNNAKDSFHSLCLCEVMVFSGV